MQLEVDLSLASYSALTCLDLSSPFEFKDQITIYRLELRSLRQYQLTDHVHICISCAYRVHIVCIYIYMHANIDEAAHTYVPDIHWCLQPEWYAGVEVRCT